MSSSRAGRPRPLPEWVSQLWRDPYCAGLAVFGAVILGGFAAIGLAWRGVARTDLVYGQAPWVISGGLAGVLLVGVGLSLFSVQINRKHAARRRDAFDSMLDDAIGLLVHARALRQRFRQSAPIVLAGSSVYHLRTCRRAMGAGAGVRRIPLIEAREQGMRACRICHPE